MTDNEHVIHEKAIMLQSTYHETTPVLTDFVRGDSTLAEYLETIEKTVIRQHLLSNEGNISKTAKDLGMIRQNLQHKIKKYGLT